jgi:hypothetical protein
MHTKLQLENLKGKKIYHLGDHAVGGRIILKLIVNKLNMMVWAGFIWLRIGTSGEFL